MKNSEKLVSGIKFLNKIDEILEDKGQTRKKLCETLQILQGTMATWKTKDIMPPVDTVKKIANELEVSVDWLLSDDSDFERKEELLGERSRKSIRQRIYESLSKKYYEERRDERLSPENLRNEANLQDIHEKYLDYYVSYWKLFNWSKGRCEIDYTIFLQWATELDTTINYLLLGSNKKTPRDFEPDLYKLALEYREQLYDLDNFSEKRKDRAIAMLNDLMWLQHYENVEASKNKSAGIDKILNEK